MIVAAWHLMATIVWVRPGAPADQVALASRVHAELVVPSFTGDELEPFEEWAEMLGDGAPRVPREARTCPVR